MGPALQWSSRPTHPVDLMLGIRLEAVLQTQQHPIIMTISWPSLLVTHSLLWSESLAASSNFFPWLSLDASVLSHLSLAASLLSEQGEVPQLILSPQGSVLPSLGWAH